MPARVAVVALALVVGHGVVGCGAPSDPAVPKDVDDYVAALREIAPTEAETARAIERILRTQFVNEPEARREIAALRPRVAAALERLGTHEPRTPAVQQIHHRYVAAWEQLVVGLGAVERGFDTADASALADGRRAMEAWGRAVFETADALRAARDGAPPPSSPEPR